MPTLENALVDVEFAPGHDGAIPRPFSTVVAESWVSVGDFGLIADGSTHPLSSRYGSLEAAQVDYPFATDLAQEIDYCACKAASNVAFGEDGSENASNSYLNKRLFLPKGRYQFGTDTWLIRNLSGGMIQGAGRRATILRGNATMLAFDGIWYTHISDFSMECQTSTATAAMELDGNIPGHPYTTRGVQAVTLQNMLIDGGGSDYALAVCRQGGSSAQGSECAWINVHLQNADFASYYQNGFNALANTFLGGNFQNNPKYGAFITGGTCSFLSTGFQSGHRYGQIANDGWDIGVGSAGAGGEGVTIHGCRTESLRFLENEGAVFCDIRGVAGRCEVGGWFASTVYGSAGPVGKGIIEGGRLYVATTEGTSGTVEPVWPTDGSSIADGSIVWEEEEFDFINSVIGSGTIDKSSIYRTAGRLFAQITDTRVASTSTSGYNIGEEDVLIVDCTGGAKTVNLPERTRQGRIITVKKSDTSGNAVTIGQQGTAIGFEDGGATATIAGGSRGFKTFIDADGTAGVRRWHIIASG